MNKKPFSDTKNNQTPKPPWLRRRLPSGPAFEQTRRRMRMGRLHTVCQEAQCPNMFECFSRHTATFLILGERCTRNCSFCAVQGGPQEPPDSDEPQRVAETVAEMNLAYVVITSVTRDDLEDGGAGLFAATIRAVHKLKPEVAIEVLIPDFQGNRQALHAVLDARPDVLNHNVETVPRLYPAVRPQARYVRSLNLLQEADRYAPVIPTKSGVMLGLGETDSEIRQVLRDLRQVNCRIVTLGQYLRPSPGHHPVERFVTPEDFDHWRQVALEMGFDQAASGPFVRSSYNARETFQQLPGK